jgi:hypothetical protein
MAGIFEEAFHLTRGTYARCNTPPPPSLPTSDSGTGSVVCGSLVVPENQKTKIENKTKVQGIQNTSTKG